MLKHVLKTRCIQVVQIAKNMGPSVFRKFFDAASMLVLTNILQRL